MILLGSFSCKKKVFQSDVFIKKQWKVDLSTANEIPAISGRTDHAVAMLYLMDNDELSYDIYFDKVLENSDKPTAAKLYLTTAVTSKGTVLIDLQNGPFNEQREVKGSVKVSADQMSSLLSGLVFLDIASQQQTNGLVRGQIK